MKNVFTGCGLTTQIELQNWGTVNVTQDEKVLKFHGLYVKDFIINFLKETKLKVPKEFVEDAE